MTLESYTNRAQLLPKLPPIIHRAMIEITSPAIASPSLETELNLRTIQPAAIAGTDVERR